MFYFTGIYKFKDSQADTYNDIDNKLYPVTTTIYRVQ